MPNQIRWQTQIVWRKADDLIEFEKDVTPVIVAVRGEDDQLHVVGAVYMQKLLIDEYDEDKTVELTGFGRESMHPDYDYYYQPLDGVEWWAEMPPPPA